MIYQVFLVDCPWEFVTRGNSSAKTHYTRMTLDRLAQLPIASTAADNAVMFFWVVDWLQPSVQEAIVNAYGFEYRTRAWTWIKSNPSGFGFFKGRGFYTRSNQEDCWLCVRGKMPVCSHSISKILYTPVMNHSRKPDDQYRKIEALYPASLYPNRLELFARRPWPGWVSLGNGIDGRDIFEALAAPTRAIDKT